MFNVEDTETGDVYGPFELMSEAREQAKHLRAWVIIDDDGYLVMEKELCQPYLR